MIFFVRKFDLIKQFKLMDIENRVKGSIYLTYPKELKNNLLNIMFFGNNNQLF